jgi:DNA helicase-2/ATP-dependent DNA helicase PcrA
MNQLTDFEYLKTLNEEQRVAVKTLHGPVLVLSGAGTGKTRVLTTRIAHLLMTQTTKPWNIMAVTFTNKASREMKERVSTIIGSAAEQILMGTFHSLGAKMLRQHAELVGLKKNFTIIDVDDQIKLIKQILSNHNIDEKRSPAKLFLNIINSWKDRGLTPDKISDNLTNSINNEKQIYHDYQIKLMQSNCVDFGDLLIQPLELLRTNKDVLNQWQSKISHILIDEYQDTNTAQYLWIRLLCSKTNNICCVGDDDQSIYGWRGAEVKNILGFSKDFENAKTIRLEQNYRSTKKILEAANCLINNNNARLGKNLWTQNDEDENIEISSVYDSSEEAINIGEKIEEKIRDNRKLSEIAVLVRTISQMREIEERFISIGLPYRVVGTKFFDRLEIKDAIAYVRIICNSSDNLAFERVINTPRRGIGPTTIKKLLDISRLEDIQLFHVGEDISTYENFNLATKDKINKFIKQINEWKALKTLKEPSELIDMVLEETGYYEMWRNENSEEANTRIENLKELLISVSKFDTLEGFLQHVSLMTDNETNNITGEVTLMTLHASKGLEFETIFLPGWEEGLFPSSRSLEDNGDVGLEEERRLAYVGITRAKNEVYISYASSRRIHGLWMSSFPSRFLKELPEELSCKIVTSDYNLNDENIDYNYGNQINNPGYGPAWKRFSNYKYDKQKSFIPSNSSKINTISNDEFRRGDRVFHIKFGMGKVSNANGDKLEINFDKAGKKKIKSNFVEKK